MKKYIVLVVTTLILTGLAAVSYTHLADKKNFTTFL